MKQENADVGRVCSCDNPADSRPYCFCILTHFDIMVESVSDC